MPFNVSGNPPPVQIPLDVFSGLVSEIPAMNLPSGVSPDCYDMAFRPGSTFSRPALQKVFASSFGNVSVTYAKSYVDDMGVIRNLYLDSAGNLWVENLNTSPGTVTLLTTTTPATYAKSITAFGREYIAISDGLHGQEVPLQYDGTNLDRVTQDGPGGTPTVANLLIPATTMADSLAGGKSIIRSSNIVTVATAAPHGLQVGYLAQVSKVSAQPVNFIYSIVINNQDNPGVATITTGMGSPLAPAPHGLAAGNFVALLYVGPTVIGTAAAALASRTGQVVTFSLTGHGLNEGAVIQTTGFADTTFNSTFTVASVIDVNTFTAAQVDADAGVTTGGTVSLVWPQTGPSVNSLWEVIACPTDSSFQVAIEYTDGTWSATGAVFFPWDRTAYVSSVPTPTTFTYLDYGPDGTSSDLGTVTPTGQVAPGIHQMQILFLTRQGYTTAPSPPVQFIANGDQYLTVTNIPIGPSNVVARILAFTGASGAEFFYIPDPAIVNSQQVSTATQINDNTTTSVTLDFSDVTLFNALGISTQGNNLAGQIVLDSALGFAFFGERLITYGQRNRIQNFLNFGFDGGYFPSAPTIPTGWLPAGSPAAPGGALATGHYGQGWQFAGSGSIYQGAYLDGYGAPILTPNTQYYFRAWLKGVGATATLTISFPTTSPLVTITATITGTSATGSWVEAAFSAKTPSSIPPDTIISLSGTGGGLIDEMSVIFSQTPYLDMVFFGSYVDNPEGFNGLTGRFGPSDDTRKIMTVGIIRGTMYVLTRDPAGRLHAIPDNGVTQPAGWTVEEVSATCGVLSTFGLTVSQADDATAGGGEEWMAWASASGARIFGGNQPWIISREIYPNWDAINVGAYLKVWALNDPTAKRLYFGVPTGAVAGSSPVVLATTPNIILHVDYKNLNTAEEIAEAAPVHLSFSGKLMARDRARKWCPWRIPANGGALIYRSVGGLLYSIFFAGNGMDLGVGTACGNVFNLCDNKLTDDCLGQIFPYYTTYAFTSAEGEQGLQLGGQRHMVSYLQWNVDGIGNIKVTPLVNTITNPWPIQAVIPMRQDPQYDDEWGGGMASGQRVFLRFAAFPVGSNP